jgi:hypothetical protein
MDADSRLSNMACEIEAGEYSDSIYGARQLVRVQHGFAHFQRRENTMEAEKSSRYLTSYHIAE